MKHTAYDGCGPRLVYLDGVEIDCVVECFTGEGGYVKYAPKPHKVIDDDLHTVTEYGFVEVKYIKENDLV